MFPNKENIEDKSATLLFKPISVHLLLVLSVTRTCFTIECKYTTEGKEYAGTKQTTNSGKKCQSWVSQTPHKHTTDVNNIPDQTLVEAERFCRNPDGHPEGPWCYTQDPDVIRESCGIPFCNCKTSIDGRGYRGDVTRTRTGKRCQRWDRDFPHPHPYRKTDFPDNSFSGASNKCRNPGDIKGGPWCYTVDIFTRWELCNIPPCACRTTEAGQSYIGRLSKTKSGKTCQRWDAQVPHKHEHTTKVDFPDKSIEEAENYCRNPTFDPEGPWCFTVDPDVRKESCDVPRCYFRKEATPIFSGDPKGCQMDARGLSYAGKQSETVSGLRCQRWDAKFPHHNVEYNNASYFPDETIGEVANYCRNPDKTKDGPWCYTTSPSVRKERCRIPSCECKESRTGSEYMGKISRTRSGLTCQRWDEQFPHKHRFTKQEDFPDRTISEALNFCRNPGNEREDPWCYTTDVSTRWGYCKVPFCYKPNVTTTEVNDRTTEVTTEDALRENDGTYTGRVSESHEDESYTADRQQINNIVTRPAEHPEGATSETYILNTHDPATDHTAEKNTFNDSSTETWMKSDVKVVSGAGKMIGISVSLSLFSFVLFACLVAYMHRRKRKYTVTPSNNCDEEQQKSQKPEERGNAVVSVTYRKKRSQEVNVTTVANNPRHQTKEISDSDSPRTGDSSLPMKTLSGPGLDSETRITMSYKQTASTIK